MKRSLAALVLALATTVAAFAADQNVTLTLDGRPVDRTGGVAMLHDGIIYGDLVDLVKSFNGLLTFQGHTTAVMINGVNARFTVGSRTARIGEGSVVMRGPTIVRNGDPWVPLDTFISRVANAKLRISGNRTKADILVDAGGGPQSAGRPPHPH